MEFKSDNYQKQAYDTRFNDPCIENFYRIFRFVTEESSVEFKINDSKLTKGDGSKYGTPTGDTIWAGAFVFTNHIIRHLKNNLSGKKLLELGSGCGLTSMAALTCGTIATFTDLPFALPHLKYNMELNGYHNIYSYSIEPLDWFKPETIGEAGQFDVIIGCEVVYHEPLTEPLVKTIDYHLCAGGVVYLIGAKHRHCYLHLFHLLFTRGYTVTTSWLVPPNDDQAQFTPAQEMTVAYFSELEFEDDKKNIILMCFTKPVNSSLF